jgi:propionyl-CoA synthetase
VVLKSGRDRPGTELKQELVRLMREKIGPIASFKEVLIVKRLPKTRSGKILRGTIKKIADGVPYQVPATIEDPEVLSEIRDSLREQGFPRE